MDFHLLLKTHGHVTATSSVGRQRSLKQSSRFQVAPQPRSPSPTAAHQSFTMMAG